MKFYNLELFDEFVTKKDEGVFYVRVPQGANVSPFNAWNSVYNEYIWLEDDMEVIKTGVLSSVADYNSY